MSIVVSKLSYQHPDRQHLFSNLSFIVGKNQKVALIGSNGSGKSTILRLLAGELVPSKGSVACSSTPYYVQQCPELAGTTIARLLGVTGKLEALEAITSGSVEAQHYELLADDWDIEERCAQAMAYWHLPPLPLATPIEQLSGGERTKLQLAGLLVHQPEIVLLDEPSNHLDYDARQLLYRYIEQSAATFVVVSHDVALLRKLSVTYELNRHGIRQYGGSFDFYEEQKAIEDSALQQRIDEEQKSLRKAEQQAREVVQRQEKRARSGEKQKDQVPRILRKTFLNSAQNAAARLGVNHAEIVSGHKDELAWLRQQQGVTDRLKLDFSHSTFPQNKLLIKASAVNFSYGDKLLWNPSVDFELFSGNRVWLTGGNGAGKTTFLKLLMGELQPAEGTVTGASFSHIYLDQTYAPMNADCTVLEMAEGYNIRQLAEHEVKLRLNRFLFPASEWDKPCTQLSGGERMRLYLCCLMISDYVPDLIVLDEPSNNLDIAGMRVLTDTLRSYRGSLLVVSHDSYFVEQLGITHTVQLV